MTVDNRTFSAREEDGTLTMRLAGRLDAQAVADIWTEVMEAVRSGSASKGAVDCSGVTYVDGSGVALLIRMDEVLRQRGGGLELNNLADEFQNLIIPLWGTDFPRFDPSQSERRGGLAERVGLAAEETYRDMKDMIAFVGEAMFLLFLCCTQPGCIRWKDLFLSCITVGVQSLPIIILIGFLMGLIMSFQTAISLQRFGAEIFVPNMLGLVMFREMGPLVTAILLAARSGSAFAAEIGTMKVNEEIDALNTMGLSPMRFLVAPKIIASLVVVPFMSLFFNFASLIGGALVMLSLNFPLVTFTSRVFRNLQPHDFWGGLFKAAFFALLVAGVGCLRGMQTKTGASAVGASTTSAVVSGLILIAVADGLFAVTFYYMGI